MEAKIKLITKEIAKIHQNDIAKIYFFDLGVP